MAEVKTLPPVLAPTSALVAKGDAIRVMLEGIGALVEISPETRALAENGTQVQAILERVAPDIEMAETIMIDSADMLEEATQVLGRLATAFADTGVIEGERKALTKPFNDFVKLANGGYSPAREYGAAAMSALKTKMLAFHKQQADAAAAREAEERRQREEAAALMARQEQQAREEAAALLAQASAAQAAGAEISAAALAAEAGARVDAARSAATAQAEALTATSIGRPTVAAKGVRTTYAAEVRNLAKLAQYIVTGKVTDEPVAHPELLNLLTAQATALNQMAKAQQAGFNLPGCQLITSTGLSARKVAA